ncbi:potassium channel protein [Neolewinella lacunae]|uniref:potassium channel family protein n=1 Tax=Neolewinella lacunae TaxID=1517758 RepID=UPI0025B54685|nr:potassium channel protein [Neolewinella lacunae]MDN3633663.1 potassium channel protein [Neolewinella lacunae]
MLTRLLGFLGLRTTVLNLQVSLLLVVGTMLVMIVGLITIEGYSLSDAFYMAAITISTVGFGEVQPLSETGKVFVSVMILVNIGIVAYALATFSYYVIEGKLFVQMEQNRMRARIDALKNHTIICGFGRYGQEIARHLLEHGQSFVVVDEKEENLHLPEFAERNLPYIIGDATHDEVLQEAGISRAGSLITALSDDSDNLFIVLSAKDLNPHLRIISRAHQSRSREKMIKAGASHVIMPEQIGGFYMAALISKPGAVEFFSYVTNELESDIGFEEVRYDQLPAPLQGKNIQEMSLRQKTGVNVIGHRLVGGRYEVNPGPSAALHPGESFIVVGSQPQILALRKVLGI